jgi:selenocysteine-specific elongation factor
MRFKYNNGFGTISMKHLILGTAGHIDHGKTALVKALTGIDCDTHEEEKRRGITINLGFAHLLLPESQTMGVVDVPGHRDFVQTMVSGSSGIDIALLVVAADEGIMPQTREHVQIMNILGIQSGVIAVTKCDKADENALAVVHGRIREFVNHTFLENAEICDVSSITGTGIERLREAIARVAKNVKERSAGQVFRMYIDRIFSVSGFGTVVTGSVKGGSLKVNQTAYLLPSKKELRVRRLERFGEEVDEVRAGDRASCNLVGLSRDDFRRGMLIADRPLQSTALFDANVTLFYASKPLGIWTRVILLKDTDEAQARLHMLDADTLVGGGTAMVQVHVAGPCVARFGDRFVIRSTSGDATLGGGEILDASPLHHRRRPASLIDGLNTIADGRLSRRIAAEVQKHVFSVKIADIAESLNCAPGEIAGAFSADAPKEILVFGRGEDRFFISDFNHDQLIGKIVKNLESHHARRPLEKTGRTREELRGALGMGTGADNESFLTMMLEELVVQGTLKKVGTTYALPHHMIALSDETAERAAIVEALIADYGMQAPPPAEVVKKAAQKGIAGEEFHSVLNYLTEKKTLYAVEGAHIHCRIVDECRKKLLASLVDKPEGMTVAQFRDLVHGNRKICLLLFAIYDREGVIERRGDVRVMTENGKRPIS